MENRNENISRKFNFGKISAYNKQRRHALEVEFCLKKDREGRPVFSSSCAVWNQYHTDWIMGGQMLDDKIIMSQMKHSHLYNKIVKLWKKNHLNDLHAGTPEQEDFINSEEGKKEREAICEEYNKQNKYFKKMVNDYDITCEFLKRHGKYEVDYNGEKYRYGYGWIYREISKEDMEDIMKILDKNNSQEELEKMF